jgi:hypothetical protein
MLAYVLLLILLVPLTFLSAALENLFSPDELTAMGIHLETPQAEETL